MNVASTSNQLAKDFQENFVGTLSDTAVDNTVAELHKIDEASLKSAASYGANGSLASLIFYVKVQCVVTGSNGKTFDGQAWGVSFPGGGALFGDVYLSGASSLDDLYSRTAGFTFTATPVYTAFYFFDSSDNLLGHFQAGSISTVTGTGGGSGGWK